MNTKKRERASSDFVKTELKKLTHLKIESEPLYKNMWVKGALVVASIYGLMFVSKYFISQYADLITATKKLRNAKRL
ncbi:hypothetical protein [Aquimarina pacifica]|uniref:hypothetical protein n=1 Tax=Aquimarina pacifica TaxID=1296415 RepID=UPI000472DD80|nr:hypothetical protein [Aquimarina pacifica]